MYRWIKLFNTTPFEKSEILTNSTVIIFYKNTTFWSAKKIYYNTKILKYYSLTIFLVTKPSLFLTFIKYTPEATCLISTINLPSFDMRWQIVSPVKLTIATSKKPTNSD